MAIETNRVVKNKILRNNEYYDIQYLLDDLYAKSKENKIFTNLMELILDERNILLAYRNIKKNKVSQTPGTNGKTIKDFGNLETDEVVSYVRNRLSNFSPMKVKFKEIPKPNGKLRPLGIPTIEDRVIQQSIKQILEPICEAKFYQHSYGFRPNRSCKEAIARMNLLINISQLHYVVDFDIKGFFDNVNHGKLLKQLWTLGIRDKRLLSIISKMLKAEIENKGIPSKGTPQGGILSPLLANVVLNELDWWITNQWEGLKTRHEFKGTIAEKPNYSHKYRAFRQSTKLKEMQIVRYADDFKIMCNNHKDAQKIFIATKKWLKERLDLDISPDKSGVTNLRKRTTDFLGISIKTRKKKNKYVVFSRMSTKSKEKVQKELRRKLRYIKQLPDSKSVNMYNATLLGQHNYYNMAGYVCKDFVEIWFKLRKTIYNCTKSHGTTRGTKNKAYMKFYGRYNYSTVWISGIALYPIPGISYKNPLGFTQEKCNYTRKGRALIHSKLSSLDMDVLRYIMRNPVKNKSEEYNDNRISLYCGQQGLCAITKLPLEIGEFETHHIKPVSLGGTDKYSNLVMLNKAIHKLVHLTDFGLIKNYIKELNFTQKEIVKINDLRLSVGNFEI